MELQKSSLNPSTDFFDYPELKAFVESITGKKFYSRSYISSLIHSGSFPKSVKVSACATWRKADIVAWLQARGVSFNAE